MLAVAGIDARTAAAQESILYSFTGFFNSTGGTTPTAGITLDAQGNLYGTTENGTNGEGPGGGTAWELSQVSPGIWTEKVLHIFTGTSGDGVTPSQNGGLTFDAEGNLYGTTSAGGEYGQGTVFELTPGTGGAWTEKVLFSFDSSGIGGVTPNGGVIVDASGNLYGTASTGGAAGGGTVFELSPSSGGWTIKELHSFPLSGDDGNPNYPLTLDASGNLYGSTAKSSTYDCECEYGQGIIFELTPAADGSWTENVLHTFPNMNSATDGSFPAGKLTLDAQGNVYGTTALGESPGVGMVFELSPTSGGSWTEKVLSVLSAGIEPMGGVILDVEGNLYGTTYFGGQTGGGVGGTVFKLTHEADDSWEQTLLHTFYPGADYLDGQGPGGELVYDSQGNLYGTTTIGGGSYRLDYPSGFGEGTVFKLAFSATTVATPVISPASGSYGEAQMVAITDATPGVTIYYTTDGYEPNPSYVNTVKYIEPFPVSATGLVKAVAFNSVSAQSATTTAAFTIP